MMCGLFIVGMAGVEPFGYGEALSLRLRKSAYTLPSWNAYALLRRVPPDYLSGALPLSYTPMKRPAGIEPFSGDEPTYAFALPPANQTGALPMSYGRNHLRVVHVHVTARSTNTFYLNLRWITVCFTCCT